MSRRSPHRSPRRAAPVRHRERPPVSGRFGRAVVQGRVLRRRFRAWGPARWARGRWTPSRWAPARWRRSGWGPSRWSPRLAASLTRLRRPVAWRSAVRTGGRPGRRPLWAWPPPSTAARALRGVLAVAVFLAGTWRVHHSALLDVDRVDVAGAVQVPVAEARRAAGIDRGDPLLGADLTGARRRLEALPWVRRATVSRELPNRLRIRLTERRAVAYAARPAGGFALVDATGRVLADGPDRPEGLPEVVGAGAPPAPAGWLRPARPALRAVLALADPLRRQVSAAAVDGRSVTLQVAGREVRFGPAEDLEAKASALAALLEHLGGRPVEYLDVRVPSAPVARPAGPPEDRTAPPPAAAAPGPRD